VADQHRPIDLECIPEFDDIARARDLCIGHWFFERECAAAYDALAPGVQLALPHRVLRSTPPVSAPAAVEQEPTEPIARIGRPTGMRCRMRLLATLAAIGLLAALTGCGSGSDGPATSDAGGPITVGQLVARSADTPVAVQGLLHLDRGVARMCAAILESYPPQCGEPSVELVGLDLAAVEGTTTAGGVTWKEGAVLNLERTVDGRFTVVDASAGFAVRVVLGLYSGVPDPAWTLTTEQANELAAALAGLSRVEGTAPFGGLGYHGFTTVTADGKLVAYAGKVSSVDADPPYILNDPERTIERLLLATAQPHVTAAEFRATADALDQG